MEDFMKLNARDVVPILAFFNMMTVIT